MKEQTQKTSRAANEPSAEKPKEAPKTNDRQQPLSGIIEEEKEKTAWWETAANTIAGDNKLLSGILRFILSPLGLIIGVAFIGFGFYKMNKLKAEIKKLKKENKTLQEYVLDTEEELAKTKKKYKKLKALNEEETEYNLKGLSFSKEAEPEEKSKSETRTNKNYQTAYLN